MSFFLTLVFWAVIILAVIYAAQFIIGAIIWIFIGAVWLLSLPFILAYEKIQERKEK